MNKIRSRHQSSSVNSCCERGCVLDMEGTDDFVVLKGEKLSVAESICDCIIFDGKNDVAVSLVELKGRTSHASKIVRKLNNGGKWANDILEQEGLRAGMVTVAILAKSFHRQEYAILKSSPVVINGTKYGIEARPCGTSLKSIRRSRQAA